MKTNIRRAHQIRSLIEAEIERTTAIVPLTVLVLDEAVDDKIRKYQSDFVAAQEKAGKLEGILDRLRKTINTANHVSGLDDLLRELAALKREKQRYDRLAGFGDTTDETDDFLIRLRQAKTQFAAGNDTAEEPVVYRRRPSRQSTREDVSGYPLPTQVLAGAKARVKVIQRRVREVSDSLLAVNYNTQVEIPDADVSYLESESVI